MPEYIQCGYYQIRQRIIKPGDGKLPLKGSRVEINYEAFLSNKEKYDSTFDRNQTHVFAAGMGRLLPGLDAALMHVSTGEHVILTVPWQLAYGAAGFPPLIPQKCDLIFDVYVISVK